MSGHEGTSTCAWLIHYFFTWEFPFSPPLLPHLLCQSSGMPRASRPNRWDPGSYTCQSVAPAATEQALSPPRDLHLNKLQAVSRSVRRPNNSRTGCQLHCISLQVNWHMWQRQRASGAPLHQTAYGQTPLCSLTTFKFFWSFQETRKGSRPKRRDSFPLATHVAGCFSSWSSAPFLPEADTVITHFCGLEGIHRWTNPSVFSSSVRSASF